MDPALRRRLGMPGHDLDSGWVLAGVSTLVEKWSAGARVVTEGSPLAFELDVGGVEDGLGTVP